MPYILSALFLAYAMARGTSALPSLSKPRVLDDTAAYLRISTGPLDTLQFWAGSRPPAFPLLLKIVGQHLNLAAIVQFDCSIAAWGLLALMLSRFIKVPWLQGSAFALVLAFSLDRHISGWDSVMLTESLSISWLALFLAAGLWLLQGWSLVKLAAFFVAAFWLAFTRDTNAWILLALALILLVGVLIRWVEARGWILALGLSGIFLLSNLSATMGERWVFPLGNLITRRVLPDAAALDYFESCGMPASPALLQLTGKFANADDQAMFAGPELGAFRYWLSDRGKSCYVRWLIADPWRSMAGTLREAGGLIAFSGVDRYFSRQYNSLMPGWAGQIFYPERFTLWLWGTATLAALVVMWRRSWIENPLWAVFVCLILLVFPHLFLTWHGDAMAPDRHALSVGVELYLACLILVILLIQYLWERLQEARLRSTLPSRSTE